MIPAAAILALAGIFIGAWLQMRNWRHQNHQTTRQEQKKAALEAVEQIAALIDRRLYRQRRYLWALRTRSDAERLIGARKQYDTLLFEWNDNLGRFKASLGAFFENYRNEDLEDFHNDFQSIGRNLELYDRDSSLIEPLYRSERRMNGLGWRTSQWIRTLLNDISKDQLRGHWVPFNVSHTNWDNLSSSYLLKRLFGFVS